MERRITKANTLLDHMSPQNNFWRQELKTSRGLLRTSLADALLAAASVIYHGPLDSHTRAELLDDWLRRWVGSARLLADTGIGSFDSLMFCCWFLCVHLLVLAFYYFKGQLYFIL